MKNSMCISVVFLLLFHTGVLWAGDYFVVSGATDSGDYANCNGNYFIEGYTQNGRPVYKHESQTYYIWYDPTYDTDWVIDNDLTAGVAGFFYTSNTMTPPEGSYDRDTAGGNNPTVSKVSRPDVIFTNGANAALDFQQTDASPPENNWICGQFSLTGSGTGSTLTSVTVTLAGSYDPGDLQASPFTLYAASSNSFGAATPISGNFADPGSGNDVTFSSLSDAIPASTRYYWVTADISSSATSDDTMNGTVTAESDITLSGGDVDGSSNFGKLNAGADASLPVGLSQFSLHIQGNNLLIEWITETEIENLGFILEKKAVSASAWSLLASYQTSDKLVGQINSSSRTLYQFTDTDVAGGLTYDYRLSGVSMQGAVTPLARQTIEMAAPPERSGMEKAFPNPFNPQTFIKYTIADESQIRITVYNTRGQRVTDLFTGTQAAGNYQTFWNGFDSDGNPAPSSIYIIRMRTRDVDQTQKVMLVR